MYSDNIDPIRTPIADDTTRANAEPKNTVNFDMFLSVEKSIVAIWVLSPNSAIKIEKKIVENILRSIGFIF